MVEKLDFRSIDFEYNSSEQFATVVFDKGPDITVLKEGSYNRFKKTLEDERYNPSYDGSATCVYVREQNNLKRIIKICTIQKKGKTIIETHYVDELELKKFNLL